MSTDLLCSGPGPHLPPSGLIAVDEGVGESPSGLRCWSQSCATPPHPSLAHDRTIRDRLADDLAAIDLITGASGTAFTQAGVRDLQRQVKDLARMNKRLARLALGALDSAD